MADNDKYWKVLETKQAFKNAWFPIRRDKVLLPNGEIINDFLVSELPDVSQIFALTEDGYVIFVKQYRHAIKQVVLELPAGTFNKNEENAAEAAKRELLEETGYLAKTMIPLGKVYGYPTKDTHAIYMHLALNVENASKTSQDKTEDIEVVKIKVDECLGLIENGELIVAGSIVGVIFATNYLMKHNLV